TGHAGPLPVQFSAGSHSPAERRHVVVDASKASAGQTVLAPVHVSATSQTAEAARQVAPALPAACWPSALGASHRPVVRALPSSVQLVPAGFLASAGQFGPLPGQDSLASHSSTAPRHSVVVGSKTSLGQTVLVPVQVSAMSHTPAAARQVAPAL